MVIGDLLSVSGLERRRRGNKVDGRARQCHFLLSATLQGN
jgi:hypothetical protein